MSTQFKSETNENIKRDTRVLIHALSDKAKTLIFINNTDFIIAQS